MIEALKRKYALSEQGAKDLFKGKAPESTLERVLIGLAVSASFYALNSIARTLEKQIKK